MEVMRFSCCEPSHMQSATIMRSKVFLSDWAEGEESSDQAWGRILSWDFVRGCD